MIQTKMKMKIMKIKKIHLMKQFLIYLENNLNLNVKNRKKNYQRKENKVQNLQNLQKNQKKENQNIQNVLNQFIKHQLQKD